MPSIWEGKKLNKVVPWCSPQTLQSKHNYKFHKTRNISAKGKLTCESHVKPLSSLCERAGLLRHNAQDPVRWLQPSAITKHISKVTSMPKTSRLKLLEVSLERGWVAAPSGLPEERAPLAPLGQPGQLPPLRSAEHLHPGLQPTRTVTSSPPAPHRPSEWGKLGDTYVGVFSLNLGEISFFPFILQLHPPGI